MPVLSSPAPLGPRLLPLPLTFWSLTGETIVHILMPDQALMLGGQELHVELKSFRDTVQPVCAYLDPGPGLQGRGLV